MQAKVKREGATPLYLEFYILTYFFCYDWAGRFQVLRTLQGPSLLPHLHFVAQRVISLWEEFYILTSVENAFGFSCVKRRKVQQIPLTFTFCRPKGDLPLGGILHFTF